MAAGAPLRHLGRRAFLGVAGLGLTAACGTTHAAGADPAVRRIRYGAGHDRFGDRYLPTGTPRGTVVVLHGGYWRAGYGLDLMAPLCRDLAGRGWAAWNLEYRRLGDGGGWPATFEDVAAGVDHTAALGVPLDDVRVLGHSAGGHLAVWAASRSAATPGGAPRVRPSRVVSLAGVLDLTLGSRQRLGDGAVEELMGGTPAAVPDRYRLGDPTLLVPAGGPVACLRGRQDTTVPRDQSTSYVAAARAAGGTASLTEVAGDHFTVIDPGSDAGPVVRRLLDG